MESNIGIGKNSDATKCVQEATAKFRNPKLILFFHLWISLNNILYCFMRNFRTVYVWERHPLQCLARMAQIKTP